MDNSFIRIFNAKENNLQNLNISIPRNKLVVITGVSGSGKSSLAFDTIYAEGQRRYVESLSTYCRQFLELQSKPDVESITGLSPSIAIDQKISSKNPRSTVATMTEIYDYVRLLYARIGIPYSPLTKKPITKQSISQMVECILELPLETKIYILGVLVKDKKGEHLKEISTIKKKGYGRLKIDGIIHQIDDLPTIDKSKRHDIFVLVDRLQVSTTLGNRIFNSVENALDIGRGILYVEIVSLPNEYTGSDYHNGQILVFSENFSCPETGFVVEELEPRLFSFNTPHGACPDCQGLGEKVDIDIDLVIPNKELSISQGAIHVIGSLNSPAIKKVMSFYVNDIIVVSKYHNIDLDSPWKKLSVESKEIILFGNNKKSNKFPFEGIINLLLSKENLAIEKLASKYSRLATCSSCNGLRLNSKALSIKINDLNISDVIKFDINEAIDWFSTLKNHLSPKEIEISKKLLAEIVDRLFFLKNVGISYLTLNRKTSTLSNGENQRIKLASQIGSGLVGVIYILDEPSVGLHKSDNDLLIKTLKKLRDIGNTVIVVEHDEDTIINADYVIDMGPGAGQNGGQIIAHGTPEEIKKNPNSITGNYLSNLKKIPIRFASRLNSIQYIEIIGARANNLNNVNVKFPLRRLICVTGISGGGKSSLVIETLYKYVALRLNASSQTYGKNDKIVGLENIDKVIKIDQSPIGKTSLSNPATYIDLFTFIRTWFASLPMAKSRGYAISRFSFNVKGGRCEACKGAGYIKIEMHFLPDIHVKCDQCLGFRYNKETLEITYKGKSIYDVLEMTVDQALFFFDNLSIIRDKLLSLKDVGMGYIKLGQSSLTLSGGEAQRIKLSRELSKCSTGRTLYILDEPTTGLHFEDINKLLKILHKLVELGNTVIIIEHNLHVIKTADYIIDIGPGGGNKGGNVVASGTPEEVAKSSRSLTGKYLREVMNL